jgi:hypothetical protein
LYWKRAKSGREMIGVMMAKLPYAHLQPIPAMTGTPSTISMPKYAVARGPVTQEVMMYGEARKANMRPLFLRWEVSATKTLTT